MSEAGSLAQKPQQLAALSRPSWGNITRALNQSKQESFQTDALLGNRRS